MTNGYLKVVGSSIVQSKIVATPEPDEDGDKEKSVAVPGFIKYQDFFFFDNRNPASVKAAMTAAQAYVSRMQSKKCPAKLAIYNPPTTFEGLWTGLPYVGQGIGDAS